MKPAAGPGSRTAAAKDHRRRRYKPNPTLNPPSLASFRVEISVDRTVQVLVDQQPAHAWLLTHAAMEQDNKLRFTKIPFLAPDEDDLVRAATVIKLAKKAAAHLPERTLAFNTAVLATAFNSGGDRFAFGDQSGRVTVGSMDSLDTVQIRLAESPIRSVRFSLGSGLIDQIQKQTAAAMQIAEKKVWAHRS